MNLEIAQVISKLCTFLVFFRQRKVQQHGVKIESRTPYCKWNRLVHWVNRCMHDTRTAFLKLYGCSQMYRLNLSKQHANLSNKRNRTIKIPGYLSAEEL